MSWQVKTSTIPSLPKQKELYTRLSPYHAKLVGESYLGRKRPLHECTDVQVCYCTQNWSSLTLFSFFIFSLCWLRILPSVLFNMYASQQCLSRLKLPKISLQFWDLTLNLFALTFVLTQLLTCSPTMIRFVFSFLDNGLLLRTVSYIILPRVLLSLKYWFINPGIVAFEGEFHRVFS